MILFKNQKVTFAGWSFLVVLLIANFVITYQKVKWERAVYEQNNPSEKVFSDDFLEMTVENMQEGNTRWIKPSDIAVDESHKAWVNPKSQTSRVGMPPYTIKITWNSNENFSIYVPKGLVWKAQDLSSDPDTKEEVSHFGWQYVQNIRKLTP